MSTTLTNGLKLPDKGSVDWYADMQNNYTILDGAVGTVAEHTSQIAGKAPAVHTHTKSDITDFPAYGNAAGTICEGNDSRLSDARTPVAHTHTKSDITDLLNSNFIPSANNSYDLGSSSYQWNNIYSKSYYYNGTAWGLDKANQWTKTQDFVGENQGTEFSVNYRTCFAMYGRFDTVGKSGMFFTKFRPYKAQGSLDSSDVIQYGVDVLENEVRTNNVFDLQASGYDSNTGKFTKIDVVSGLSNANLGSSTNKWKSLNGINPGALSLPSSDSADYIDVSDYLSTNAEYHYTAPYDGWLCLYVIVNEFYPENAVGLFRSDTSANSHQWAKSVTAALNMYKQNKYQGSVMLPVESGKKYICYISLNANTTINRKQLFFYKNKGNV